MRSSVKRTILENKSLNSLQVQCWRGCGGALGLPIQAHALFPSASKTVACWWVLCEFPPRTATGWRDFKLFSPEAALTECQSTKALPPLASFWDSSEGPSQFRTPSVRNLRGLCCNCIRLLPSRASLTVLRALWASQRSLPQILLRMLPNLRQVLMINIKASPVSGTAYIHYRNLAIKH